MTDIGKDYTTQFHYKERKNDEIQSIGFKAWFRQEREDVELTTYYELYTNLTVTESIKVSETSIFITEVMSIDNLKKLSMILRSPYLYIERYKAYLYKAFEIPNLKNKENFAQTTFEVSIDENTMLKVKQILNGDWNQGDWNNSDWLIYNEDANRIFADEFASEFE